MSIATSNKPKNGSLVKAFALLDYFSSKKSQWGVRELSRHIGAHESTTYRMMSTLESLDILYKNPETDKYALGLKLYELGNRVDINASFIHLTHPELVQVALDIEETVHLGILRNGRVLMVDKVESSKGLRLDSSVGQMSPIHCTGIGKVLMAFNTEVLGIDLDLYDFKIYTEKTISNKFEFEKELRKIKKQSYAIDDQEFEQGLICVAVPVFNQKNELVAALSAAGPSVRFKKDSLLDYVSILTKGAKAIQNNIGNYKI